MSKLQPLLLAAGLALGATGLHWAADAREHSRNASRAGALVVEPLVIPGQSEWVPADGERLPVAALGLVTGRGSKFSYARSGGLWRCPEYFGAIASERRIVGLMEAVGRASRIVSTKADVFKDTQLASFGLDTASRTLLSLHGPGFVSDDDRDVLWSIELGGSIPGASATGSAGCYARLVGSDEILELDLDLRALLADPPPPPDAPRRAPRGDRPPLLERRLVPGGWPGARSGIRRIVLDRSDGTGFEMTLSSAGELGPNGEPPAPIYQLRVQGEPGPPVATNQILSTGYTLFLIQAQATECVDPRTVDTSRANNPEAVLTLEPLEGPPLELRVLAGGLGQDPLVIDGFGRAVYRVSKEISRLLTPEPEQLTDPSLGIAWDDYLR